MNDDSKGFALVTGTPGYGVSKAALNALTRLLAAELKPSGILVNSACPGRAAALPEGGPTGGLFRDGRPPEW